jgi:hypothetical protein
LGSTLAAATISWQCKSSFRLSNSSSIQSFPAVSSCFALCCDRCCISAS